MDNKTRVVLCEDQRLFRQLLGHYVHRYPNFLIVGEESDGRKALDMCLELEPDLVLLDLGLPNLHGMEILKQVKKKLPKTKVVVITMSIDEETFLQARRLNVDGFLEKDAPIEMVCRALYEVVEGPGAFFSERYAHLLSGPPRVGRPPQRELTTRETDVLRLLAEGLNRDGIARRLGLNVTTVQKYLAQIRDKTCAETDLELVSYAQRNGITNTGTA